jgi:hypothetical protein
MYYRRNTALKCGADGIPILQALGLDAEFR